MNCRRSLTLKLPQAWRRNAVARASTSATEVSGAAEATSPDKSTPSEPRDLYQRLSSLGNRGSAFQTLDNYIAEDRRVGKPKLLSFVRQLRKFRHYKTAHEILLWMEKQNVQLSLSELSLVVDLLAKVKGVAAAETYFGALPAPAKNRFSYGALLSCYCKELMEDKVLDLFKKMEALGFAAYTLNYNNLMTMYLKLGKPDKVQQLLEEMKQRKIEPDSVTFNILINSYSSKGDTEGVERVWQEMLDNYPTLCDWTSYSNLAVHYVKVGLYEKAESALKKLESLMKRPTHDGYHYLISLYARTCNHEELCRVWESLKKAFPSTTNSSYLTMLQSLSRLGDIEGLTKCFREWESNCKRPDYRLAKPLIDAYLKRGMIEEALSLYDECAAKNSRPLFGCIDLFIIHFLKNGQVGKSLEFFKAAVSASKEEKWIPNVAVMGAWCKHFEGTKDVGFAKELCKLMKEFDSYKRTAYLMLLKAYVAAGETAPEVRKMLEEDKVGLDDELDELLDKVCPP